MTKTPKRRARIIAEACANHLGDHKLQEEMIWAAAEAGADYIKFQSWQAKTNARGQAEQMSAYELSDDDHHRLMDVSQQAGIAFATTVFNVERVSFVASLKCDFVKVASPDCSSLLLLEELVAAGIPQIIISTGMSNHTEVQATADRMSATGTKMAFLHCMYPLADGAFHLRRMETLRQFAPETGLSDHSAGDDLRASKLAIAMGADWIERHYILDRNCPKAKDAPVSIDTAGLKELVDASKEPEPHLALADEYPELMGDAEPVLSEKVRSFREFYVGRWGDNTKTSRAA